MSCTGTESGTLVNFAYIPEAVCGTTPTLTSVSNVAADRTGSVSKFTRASGSWISDGFVVEMYVIVAGFAATGNNTNWRVIGVTSTDLTVSDIAGVLTTETAEAGQTCAICFGTLRLTSPRALNTERETIESDEVRATRQVTDVRHGFSQPTGSLGFELSLESQTTLFGIALGGTWVKPTLTGSPNLAITAATPAAGKARITRAAGSFVTDGFRLGDVWNATGFTNPVNNIQWQVLAVTATTIDLADPSSVAVNQTSGAGPTLTFAGWRMDSKTDLRTMTVERRFTSSGNYDAFKGLTVNEMSWDLAPKEAAKGTATLLGMTSTALSGTSIATTGIAPPPTSGFMTMFSAGVYENATRQAYLTNLSLNLSNNRTTEAVIGSAYSPAIFEGRARGSGTATFFFTDAVMANKFYNETASSITLRIQDATVSTDFIAITIPKVKYTSAPIDPPQEGPVPVAMDFTALGTTVADPAGASVETCITIQISRM